MPTKPEPSQTELVTVPKQSLEVSPALNPGQMMQAMIQSGVTAENVAAFTELVKLSEHMEDRTAVKQFTAAFVALQSEMPKVKATKAIPSNDGSVRSRFAPYEEIMEQVAPLLQKHGFTVMFSTDFREGRLLKTCTLQHVGGHSRSNTFAVRIGSGPPKASEAQADGAASTYAKRFAICDALNIVVDVDVDARAEGGPVTQEQADELERRVAETNSNREAFLKVAGAANYVSIPAAKYAMLDELLKKKERR